MTTHTSTNIHGGELVFQRVTEGGSFAFTLGAGRPGEVRIFLSADEVAQWQDIMFKAAKL